MHRRITATVLHLALLLAIVAAGITATTLPAAAQGSATLNIILRGCAQGIDPLQVADPAAACTIPLDAPDAAGVFWGGDGQGGMPLGDAQRISSDGSYQLTIPANMDVSLFGFEPSVYDDYVFVGADSTANGEAIVNLPETGYQRVAVYYIRAANTPAGTATLNIRLRSCGDQNPLDLPDPATECTTPLDAPDEAGIFWGGDGQGGIPFTDTTRLYDGTYSTLIPANHDLAIFNLEPSVHDDFAVVGAIENSDGEFIVNLNEGETLTVLVFYFNND